MATDTPSDSPDRSTKPDLGPDELRARNAVLSEELQRLRVEYARARRAAYRRTAFSFAFIGSLAAAGGFVFASAQTILFALGGTGLFIAVLTYYLTPEQFITASIGEGTYSALADTASHIEAELGLADVHLYVPTDGPEFPVRLYVPQHEEYVLPDGDLLESVFVIADDGRNRGVSFVPTGHALVDEFTTALVGELESEPEALASQLVDGIVEQFELAETVTWEFDADGTHLTFGVSGPTYGPLHRFDHPVASFLAVGLARALDAPVRVTIPETNDEHVDGLITCRWGDV